MRLLILDVPIDAATRAEAERRAAAMLAEPRFHLVTTPNPEFLVTACRDEIFREILAGADLNLPDGGGLLIWSRLVGQPLPERIPGADFTVDLCRLAAAQGQPVYFLGGERPQVAARAAAAMKQRFPKLIVAGSEAGGRVALDTQGRWRAAPGVVERIRDSQAAVVLVAFGHGRQEKWINDNLRDVPTVRLAIGIGGTFDFLAGDVRRAPTIFRRVSMEWLWRLLVEPWRWRRIWTAVVVFPWLAFREKIR